MLRDTTGDETVTQDLREATIFPTQQAAANRASRLGWRIWTGWREDGSSYVSRAECPRDIKQ